MNDERERLRRLMVEAVEPIHPAPGSQARLAARIDAAAAGREPSAKKARSRWRVSPAGLGWSAAGLSTAAVVAAAAIFFATHGSRTGSSSASSGVGAATAAAPSGPAAAASGTGATHRPVNPQEVALGDDLDGDGVRDTFTLTGSTLSVQLSRDGQLQVTLPATGSGARVLGVTQLVSPSGTGVRVVFVRLVENPGFSQDAIAALVDGGLTTLRFGSTPAVLTVDATHGYACSDGELAVAGNPVPYAVQGDQLVASPRLRAVRAAPGEATGC